MSPTDISFYKQRAYDFSAKSQNISKKARTTSLLRVITFISMIVISLMAADKGYILLFFLTIFIFIIVFSILVYHHNQLTYLSRHFEFLSQVNEDEILRIQGKLDTFENGRQFQKENHPYHIDLDIFGSNSLFQLLNRTTTFWGRKVLSSWISDPAVKEEIQARQAAIQELAEDINWSQEFQATGKHHEDHANVGVFLSWLENDPLILGNRFYDFIRFFGPFTLLTFFVFFLFSVISFIWILFGITIHALVLLFVLEKVKIIHESTASSIKSLQSFEALITMVEKKKFRSNWLQKTKSIFQVEGLPASRTVGHLKRIFQRLDNRFNLIYQLVNLILLLDIHYAISAEKWKKRQPDNIKKWFLRMGEMEALNSLTGYHHANPEYSFPEISREAFLLQAENMGHPLIPYNQRVNNDFSLEGQGTIALVTGSNMAGKTTFLRTVGVNTVLALMGAPVCADSMKVSNFRVFTSMRTQDNLEENISSFYAELKRIRQLFDYIKNGYSLFFLLDEILKGTNSHDRHLGAVSLVHQLSGENITGLISTHDLELAKNAKKATRIVNYSFESSIHGDEIFFNYKLKPGICQTFNASKLMEKMGIRLLK